jgi:hypothetical protein
MACRHLSDLSASESFAGSESRYSWAATAYSCIDTLLKMSQHQTVSGLVIQQSSQDVTCKVCIEANLKHTRNPNRRTRTNLRPLEIVGSDLQEYETTSWDGGKFLAIYADHDTGFLATMVLKNKNDQERGAPDVISRLERMSGRKVDTLRADQGGEYTSDGFRAHIRSMGVRLEYSDTARAHQNGLAEVMGGKITRMMRAARVRSGVPRRYWSENARYQTWIHNRVSLRRQHGLTTPLQEMTGVRADVSRARIFGCEAWVLIRRNVKAKLDAKAERGVFLGVCLDKKAYRVLLWASRKIIDSSDVVLFENIFPFKDDTDPGDRRSEVMKTASEDCADGDEYADNDEGQDDQGGVLESDLDDDTDQGGDNNNRRRSTRASKPPERFSDIDYDDLAKATRASMQENLATEFEDRVELDEDDGDAAAGLLSVMVDAVSQDELVALIAGNLKADPKNQNEARARPDAKQWIEAELAQLADLQEQGAYEVVDQVLPTGFNYRIKRDENGDEAAYKARFHVKGCCDKNKAFKETFAPTLRYSTRDNRIGGSAGCDRPSDGCQGGVCSREAAHTGVYRAAEIS